MTGLAEIERLPQIKITAFTSKCVSLILAFLYGMGKKNNNKPPQQQTTTTTYTIWFPD